jgi:hypothetical protein
MSTHPRLEARVTAQERRQLNLEAYMEELSEDMTASVKHLSASIKHLSDDMTASFNQQAVYQIKTENEIDSRFNQVDKHLNQIDTRLDKIEATMATKEDLATMENRILDAFKQLLTAVNSQQPPSQ